MTKEQKGQESNSEVYLDSNFFIYASVNNELVGDNARAIIEKISNGILAGFTATLTIDEVLWEIQNNATRDKAAESASLIMNIPNLELINVNRDIIKKAIEIYKEDCLDPRDAIHLAAMKSKNLKVVFSTDSDFDKIKGIQRIDFTK